MPDIKYKVLRQLLFVQAELLRKHQPRAFETCCKGYVNITCDVGTVASVGTLKSVRGVGKDGIVKWLKHSTVQFRYQSIRTRPQPPPPAANPRRYASVVTCLLALVHTDASDLVPEAKLQANIRTVLDADAAKQIDKHLLEQIVARVLGFISGKGHPFLKRQMRLGMPHYQLTPEGRQALQLHTRWADQAVRTCGGDARVLHPPIYPPAVQPLLRWNFDLSQIVVVPPLVSSNLLLQYL